MPILDVELVGDAPPGCAQRIADAAGDLFGLGPGRVWVKLRALATGPTSAFDEASRALPGPGERSGRGVVATGAYAENGSVSEDLAPVFVSVLRADVPCGEALSSEIGRLTTVIAHALGRPAENVHIFYRPPAGGRVAFGGQLVSPVRTPIQSGAPWEDRVGFSRLIRDRGHVYVSGTAPVGDDGATFAPGQPYEQTRRCLEIIERALAPIGLDRRAIVRTRLFVTDISRWEEFGRAHREFFDSSPSSRADGERGLSSASVSEPARPATTMVEVRRLIEEDMLIEIEADARE